MALTNNGTDLGIDNGVIDDIKAKVSGSDTISGYLFDKLKSAGGSVTFSITNTGGDEKLNLEVDASGSFVAGEGIAITPITYTDQSTIEFDYANDANLPSGSVDQANDRLTIYDFSADEYKNIGVDDLLSLASTDNFANANLTLTGDRTHTLGAYDVLFSSSGATNHLYLESGGFVGIGTATQSGTDVLGVSGSSRFSGDMGIGDDSASGVRLRVRAVDATASNYAFAAQTNVGGQLFAVRADGYIGRGIVAPVKGEDFGFINGESGTGAYARWLLGCIAGGGNTALAIDVIGTSNTVIDPFYQNKSIFSIVNGTTGSPGMCFVGDGDGSLYFGIENTTKTLGEDALALKIEKSNLYLGIGTKDEVPNTRVDLLGDFAIREVEYDLTADVDDLPTADASTLSVSNTTGSAKNITGIVGHNGKFLFIYNVAADDVVLKHDDAASAADNRFLNIGASDVTLATNQFAYYHYNETIGKYVQFI